MQFVFIVSQVQGYPDTLKPSCRPLAFTSYKYFLENKKMSGTSFPALVSAWFLETNVSHVIFY